MISFVGLLFWDIYDKLFKFDLLKFDLLKFEITVY